MERKLFGTDGIRGIANIYPMTAEIALKLGQAVAKVLINEKKRHFIIVNNSFRCIFSETLPF